MCLRLFHSLSTQPPSLSLSLCNIHMNIQAPTFSHVLYLWHFHSLPLSPSHLLLLLSGIGPWSIAWFLHSGRTRRPRYIRSRRQNKSKKAREGEEHLDKNGPKTLTEKKTDKKKLQSDHFLPSFWVVRASKSKTPKNSLILNHFDCLLYADISSKFQFFEATIFPLPFHSFLLLPSSSSFLTLH